MTKKDQEKLEKNNRDLLRELLGGLKLSDVTLLDSLSSEDRKQLCQYCFGVVNNPFYRLLGKDLTLQTMQHVAVSTKDFQEDLFNRATINGIQMLGELFEKYAAEWEAKYAVKTQEFDRFKPFEATKQLAEV